MKSLVAVFGVSALFGLTIEVVYAVVARREASGMALLGIMTIALAFAALYAYFAEREAKLEGDDEDAEPPSWAGDDLGVYTSKSAWPILLSACVGLGLLALLWSPVIAALVLVAFLLCLWRLGAESARQD
jgi:uncharacterized membrane protein HdeD (DUF308 family)